MSKVLSREKKNLHVQLDLFHKNVLLDFLVRYPWSDMYFLRAFIKKPELILEQNYSLIRNIEIKGIGKCFSINNETLNLVPGIWRFRIARAFSLNIFGPEVVFKGASPGPIADAELWFKENYFRIWVDMGGVAPESLRFVTNPPKDLGPNIYDIVVTMKKERVDYLSTQISMYFKHNDVKIFVFGEMKPETIHIFKTANTVNVWQGYSADHIDNFIKSRRSKSTHRLSVCKLAIKMSDTDWAALIGVGNNPTFSLEELSFALAENTDLIKRYGKSLNFLLENGLIQVKRKNNNRLLLSPTGIEMISMYWGVDQEMMAKFNPWPIKKNEKGVHRYSLGWADNIPEHTELTRRFVLSMIDCARRVTNNTGGINTNLVTIVGNRIIYKDEKNDLSYVIPDGIVDISIFERVNDNKVSSGNRVVFTTRAFIEIDRASKSKSCLEEKIGRLSRAFKSFKNKPTLLWVVDTDDPGREYLVIKELQEYPHIPAWTTTVQRMTVDPKSEWWFVNPNTVYELPVASHGGMNPWQRIWFSNQDTSLSYKPLFNISPWENVSKVIEKDFLICELQNRRPGFM